LAAGAKADVVTPSGESALHFLAAVVPEVAQRSAYRRVLADLVSGGASVLASRGGGGVTPLHIAAREGNAVAAYVLLTSSNVDADAVAATKPSVCAVGARLGRQLDAARSVRGAAQRGAGGRAAGRATAPAPTPAWTALHWAAALGDVDLCELMLVHGVTQMSAEDEHGTWQTPEEIARARGHDTVVALLRRHSRARRQCGQSASGESWLQAAGAHATLCQAEMNKRNNTLNQTLLLTHLTSFTRHDRETASRSA
jgi:ankyrin repeat protein